MPRALGHSGQPFWERTAPLKVSEASGGPTVPERLTSPPGLAMAILAIEPHLLPSACRWGHQRRTQPRRRGSRRGCCPRLRPRPSRGVSALQQHCALPPSLPSVPTGRCCSEARDSLPAPWAPTARGGGKSRGRVRADRASPARPSPPAARTPRSDPVRRLYLPLWWGWARGCCRRWGGPPWPSASSWRARRRRQLPAAPRLHPGAAGALLGGAPGTAPRLPAGSRPAALCRSTGRRRQRGLGLARPPAAARGCRKPHVTARRAPPSAPGAAPGSRGGWERGARRSPRRSAAEPRAHCGCGRRSRSGPAPRRPGSAAGASGRLRGSAQPASGDTSKPLLFARISSLPHLPSKASPVPILCRFPPFFSLLFLSDERARN